MDFDSFGWLNNEWASHGDNDDAGGDDTELQDEFGELPVKPEPPIADENDGDAEHSQYEVEDDDMFVPLEPLQELLTDDNGQGKSDDDALLFDFGDDAPNTAAAATETNAEPSPSRREPQIDYEYYVVHICPACGSEFDHQELWKRHLNQVHDFNTRKGLNFIQVDRLYHRCMECHKQIAMHAMENLLKHKFTHLPYRCVKCRICLRQYKYRQDLMVHLRMVHGAEMEVSSRKVAELAEQVKPADKRQTTAPHGGSLAIRNIQSNAIDLFDSPNEDIEVRNELIDEDDTDEENIEQNLSLSDGGGGPSTFLEDSQSRSSSPDSADNQPQEDDTNEDELLELYVHYSCPECSTEFGSRQEWTRHIDSEHGFTTREGLNFQPVQKQVQCLECNKVLFDTSLPNMQQHKFSHLQCTSWLRCKLCFRSFVGQKPIVKHLISQHRLGPAEVPIISPRPRYRLVAKARDNYEPHILHLCPQCGKEFGDKKLWRKHIIVAHHLTDLKVLRFEIISESHVRCLECDKVITNAYGVQNAQQHAITHMKYKAFVKCRLCSKTYTDRKGLVKHLNSKHRSTILGVTPQEWQHKMDLKKLRREQQRQQAILNAAKAKQTAKPKPEPHTETVYSEEGEWFIIRYLDEDDEKALEAAKPLTRSENLSSDHQLLTELLSTNPKKDSPKSIPRPTKHPGHRSLLQKALQPPPPPPPRDEPDEDPAEANEEEDLLVVPSTSQGAASAVAAPEPEADDDEADKEAVTPRRNGEFRLSGIEKNFCFLCPACGVVFACQYDWRRHINSVHNFDKRHYLSFRPLDKYRYQCTICRDIVGNPKLKGLQDHKFRHLPYRLYIKCMICSTCYNHKPNMISHLAIRHGIRYGMGEERPERPLTGGKSARSPMSVALKAVSKLPGLSTVEDCISYHNAVDHESISYHCPMCDKLFDTHVYWRKHIVEEHNLNNREGLNFRQIDAHHYLCLQCYKRVTVTHTKGAIGQLQSHKFRHLPYRSFHCKTCSCEFVRKQMFFKHLDRKTNKCMGYQAAKGADDGEADADENENGGGGQEADSPAAVPKAPKTLLNHQIFVILCPECGGQFNAVDKWHQHLAAEHQLVERENLGFEQLSANLYECLECGEQLNTWKLAALQQHKFKHLPHHSYIQCKLCSLKFRSVRCMFLHLRQMHTHVVHPPEEQAKLQALLEYDDKPTASNRKILNASADSPQEDLPSGPAPEPDEEPVDDLYILG